MKEAKLAAQQCLYYIVPAQVPASDIIPTPQPTPPTQGPQQGPLQGPAHHVPHPMNKQICICSRCESR